MVKVIYPTTIIAPKYPHKKIILYPILNRNNRIRPLSRKSLINQESTHSQTKDPYFNKIHSSNIWSLNSSINDQPISWHKQKEHRRRKHRCVLFLQPNTCCCLIYITLAITSLFAAIAAGVMAILSKSLTTIPTTSISPTMTESTTVIITTQSPTVVTTQGATFATTTQSTTVATTTQSTTVATTTQSTTVTTIAIGNSTTSFNSTFNVNLLVNGNGETGPCQNGSGITHPTGWNYSGPITQISYNVPNKDLTSTDPGPSDRGNCYFYGQTSNATAMWQTVTLTNTVDPFLIDNHTVKFNLSAWIGGWSTQNDNAKVSVVFYDQTNQMLGNQTTIGPVLAADRGCQSSLLFRQATDFVPIGTRSFTVFVNITCVAPTSNDGDVDNIGIYFYT